MIFLAVFLGCAVGWSLMGVARSVFEHWREHRRGRAAVGDATWASQWKCTKCEYECVNEMWRKDFSFVVPTEDLYGRYGERK